MRVSARGGDVDRAKLCVSFNFTQQSAHQISTVDLVGILCVVVMGVVSSQKKTNLLIGHLLVRSTNLKEYNRKKIAD